MDFVKNVSLLALSLLSVLYSQSTYSMEPEAGMNIFEAAEEGKLARVEELIREGADINMRDVSGFTPLLMAVKNDNVAIVQALISAGARVNVQDGHGKTPLHNAVEKGNLAIVQALINAGADVNLEDSYGRTAVTFAVELGHVAEAILHALIKAGAHANNCSTSCVPLLQIALMEGFSAETCNLLIQAGADVNLQNRAGNTALHLAVIFSRCPDFEGLEMVKVLLQARADILPNECGITPLQDAEKYGPSDIAAVLTAYAQSIQQAHQRKRIIAHTIARATHPRLGGHDKGPKASPMGLLSQNLLAELALLAAEGELNDFLEFK